jgi:DNA polymerase-3 subunit alpha
LSDLFNNPINKVSFEVNSNESLDSISKTLVEEGITEVNLNIVVEDKTLKFKLKNTRNLDRKSINLLRKREISSTIS